MKKRFYIGRSYKIIMKLSVELVQYVVMIIGIIIEQLYNKYHIAISDNLVSEDYFITFRALEGTTESFRQLPIIIPFTMTRI